MLERNVLTKLSSRVSRFSASLARTRTVRMVNEKPIVSFTFDDFPKSAVRVGAKILERRGATGTFYLSRLFCGAVLEGIDYYDLSDLSNLLHAGHEIGCHTASHLHVPQIQGSRLIDDIDSNAQFVREHLGDFRLTTFAYPFGDIDLRTKLLLQGRFAACRSSFPGVNTGSADLGALRATRLYSSTMTLDQVRARIVEAAKPSSWLVSYTHDVSDAPGPFGCTPALLEMAVDAALSAGCLVLPVRNALGAVRFGS
jgi:peptidoglycan/xylan/chitin deacetylase (PgdA/CDA1 family)